MRLNRILPVIFFLTIGVLSCEETELLTSVEGTVFKGPIKPVAIVGENNNAPFSAEFHVIDYKENLILSFNSDESGRYSINLVPGFYKIVPDDAAPLMAAEYQIKEINVGEEPISGLDLYFDTGIR